MAEEHGNNYTIERARGRMNKMLGNAPMYIKRKFQYDLEASYSFTDLGIARALADRMLTMPGITRASVVTDAMASVGGNSIAFAEKFARVYSIELNPGRKSMLDNNIKLWKLRNVTTYLGYTQEVLPTLTQDIVFFDPPWGGLDYKKHPAGTLKITLSTPTGESQSFEDLVCETIPRAKYIITKLPINYDIEGLIAAVSELAAPVHRECHGRPNTSFVAIFERIG